MRSWSSKISPSLRKDRLEYVFRTEYMEALLPSPYQEVICFPVEGKEVKTTFCSPGGRHVLWQHKARAKAVIWMCRKGVTLIPPCSLTLRNTEWGQAQESLLKDFRVQLDIGLSLALLYAFLTTETIYVLLWRKKCGCILQWTLKIELNS